MISNGSAITDYSGYPYGVGGGIYLQYSIAEFDSLMIKDNFSDHTGRLHHCRLRILCEEVPDCTRQFRMTDSVSELKGEMC